MTRTIQSILAAALVVLILVVAVAARGTQTWGALDARNAALAEGNRYAQQLEARVNAFDGKEAALTEGNRYVQQLEARLKAHDEGQP